MIIALIKKNSPWATTRQKKKHSTNKKDHEITKITRMQKQKKLSNPDYNKSGMNQMYEPGG